MNIEEIKQRLKSEGYSTVSEYNDPANEFFADHMHPVDEHLIVMTGSMVVDMDGKHYNLVPGDELFFPANMMHSARMGLSGCFYIVGEKSPV